MTQKVHAVGVLFEDLSGEILVLKRHASRPEAHTWGLVGGNIDPGEDKATAAVREAKEETGHTVPTQELQFMKTYVWQRKDATITFEVFRYKANKNEIEIVLAAEESTDYAWAQPNDLHKRPDLMAGLYPILKDTYTL